MSVYVDPWMPCLPKGQYRWSGVSHMFADTLDELHSFATRLGLKRAWFQDHPLLKHYDLNASRRAKAVKLGAVELDRRAAVSKWHELREGEHATRAPSPSAVGICDRKSKLRVTPAAGSSGSPQLLP